MHVLSLTCAVSISKASLSSCWSAESIATIMIESVWAQMSLYIYIDIGILTCNVTDSTGQVFDGFLMAGELILPCR